jgi:hypothetical protein
MPVHNSKISENNSEAPMTFYTLVATIYPHQNFIGLVTRGYEHFELEGHNFPWIRSQTGG